MLPSAICHERISVASAPALGSVDLSLCRAGSPHICAGMHAIAGRQSEHSCAMAGAPTGRQTVAARRDIRSWATLKIGRQCVPKQKSSTCGRGRKPAIPFCRDAAPSFQKLETTRTPGVRDRQTYGAYHRQTPTSLANRLLSAPLLNTGDVGTNGFDPFARSCFAYPAGKPGAPPGANCSSVLLNAATRSRFRLGAFTSDAAACINCFAAKPHATGNPKIVQTTLFCVCLSWR